MPPSRSRVRCVVPVAASNEPATIDSPECFTTAAEVTLRSMMSEDSIHETTVPEPSAKACSPEAMPEGHERQRDRCLRPDRLRRRMAELPRQPAGQRGPRRLRPAVLSDLGDGGLRLSLGVQRLQLAPAGLHVPRRDMGGRFVVGLTCTAPPPLLLGRHRLRRPDARSISSTVPALRPRPCSVSPTASGMNKPEGPAGSPPACRPGSCAGPRPGRLPVRISERLTE